MAFFMKFASADCDKIAIENPCCIMNTAYRKPDQIIDPYMFAESEEDTENYVTKRTCLWLKGLNPLITNDLPKPDNEKLFGRHPSGKIANWEERVGGKDRGKARSKTFEGIAKAMADQWGDKLVDKEKFIHDVACACGFTEKQVRQTIDPTNLIFAKSTAKAACLLQNYVTVFNTAKSIGYTEDGINEVIYD